MKDQKVSLIYSRFYSLFFLVLAIFSYTGKILAQSTPPTNNLSGQLGERLVERNYSQQGLFLISPDGTKVVYTAVTQPPEATFEPHLYIVDIDGGNPRKILDYNIHGFINDLKFSHNSEFLIVHANYNIYSIKLSDLTVTTLVNGTTEYIFKISPDSQTVVFTGFANAEFFSVPINGGIIERLDDLDYAVFDSADFVIGSDSAHVFFAVSNFDTGSSQIIRVPIRGGENVELLPTGPNDLLSWQVSPNASHIVFSLGASTSKLYSVEADGANMQELASVSGFISFRAFIAPDSDRIVYVRNNASTFSTKKIFTTTISGATSVQLDGGIGDYSSECAFRFSSDSERAVACIVDTSNSAKFYLINFNASPTVTPLVSGDSFETEGIEVEFRGDLEAIYVGSRVRDEPSEMYEQRMSEIDLISNSKTTIFDYATSTFGCEDDLFSVAGSIVSFCEDVNSDGMVELRTANTSISTITQSVKTVDSSEQPLFFRVSPDARFLVYITYLRENDRIRFFLKSSNLENLDFSRGQDELCFPITAGQGKQAVVCL